MNTKTIRKKWNVKFVKNKYLYSHQNTYQSSDLSISDCYILVNTAALWFTFNSNAINILVSIRLL